MACSLSHASKLFLNPIKFHNILLVNYQNFKSLITPKDIIALY